MNYLNLYGALDALVLASSREGWANVLLESMACGTPVIASRIWGTPEVVSEPAAGVLMPERSGAGVAAGVKMLMAAMPNRDATRAYAERLSSDATTEGQLNLLRAIVARGDPHQAHRPYQPGTCRRALHSAYARGQASRSMIECK